MPVDLATLPKDYPAGKRESAEIINFAIASKTYRIDRFSEAIKRDHENALAWFNRGTALLDVRNYRAAIKDFSRAIELDPTDRGSYNNRGIAYCQRNVSEYALAIDDFDKVLTLPGAREPALHKEVAAALHNKSTLLDALGRHEQAIATSDDLIARFGKSDEPDLRRFVAMALLGKASSQGSIGRHEQAIATSDDLIARFGKSDEPDLRRFIARALLEKARSQDAIGHHERAIATSDDLISRFGKSDEPDLRRFIATALLEKASSLNALGHHERAIGIYNDILAYANDPPGLHFSWVTTAWRQKFNIFNSLAQKELAKDHFRKGCEYYRKAIECDEARRKVTETEDEQTYTEQVKIEIEEYLLKYYSLSPKEKNPSNGYDLPKRIITEAELREYISEQAALITDRLSQPGEQPFPILNERTVKAIIAHGKQNPWDDRKKQGWPYHTNLFVYVHIVYREWANQGLTREILGWADSSLNTKLARKISVEGLPEWLDLPTGAEARARAITDPVKRNKLEIVREYERDRWRQRHPKQDLS